MNKPTSAEQLGMALEEERNSVGQLYLAKTFRQSGIVKLKGSVATIGKVSRTTVSDE